MSFPGQRSTSTLDKEINVYCQWKINIGLLTQLREYTAFYISSISINLKIEISRTPKLHIP